MALVSVNVAYEGQNGNTATKYRQAQNPPYLEVIDTADSAKIVSIRALVADDDSSAVVITVIPDQRDPGKKVALICEETYADFVTASGESVSPYITEATFPTNFSAIATKKAATALVAGVKDFTDAAIRSTSVVTVERVSRGGTFAARGYNVTMVDGVKFTVTAINGSDLTETACTDTVMAIVHY